MRLPGAHTLTLRARIAAVASLAVALAVLGAAIGVYVAVRGDLRGQLDSALRQRAQAFLGAGPPPGGTAGAHGETGLSYPARPPAGAAAGSSRGSGFGAPRPEPGATPRMPSQAGDGDVGGQVFPRSVQPRPYGAPAGYVQFVAPDGAVFVPGGQGAGRSIPLSARDRAIAASGRGSALGDRTVRGTRLRVLTAGAGARGAVLVALPLAEVDHELSHLELLLLAIGLGGIALAALLGALVARTALAPVADFTRRAERLSGGLDLSERLPVVGGDELARLAASFNATLDALERSVDSQRRLIADAGHELRTPIASLRANIQILQEAERLAPEDRESLRRDIVEELDELTSLIGDVVALARGAAPEAVRAEIRLDALVDAAVDRARRRAGEVGFVVDVEPTLVRADAQSIARAISNLLENARRWSPSDGCVEIRLHGGELTVRDHGPGFAARDLPFVFDRFYRADDARRLPGSGLGLAIVRQAAEAHGGYARAENADGGGALLRVHFGTPLAQGTAAAVD